MYCVLLHHTQNHVFSSDRTQSLCVYYNLIQHDIGKIFLTNPHCASYARDTPGNWLAFLTKSELIVKLIIQYILLVDAKVGLGCER